VSLVVLELPVVEHGPQDGEPVLCLHGFPQDATAYDGVGRLLGAEGMRVLAPHQRGYTVQALPHGRAAYTMGALVEDAIGVLDQRGLSAAHVVGHDWGGAVAWALAAWTPDRVRSLTVLSTPHPRAMASAAKRSSQLLRSAYMGAFQVPALPERVALAHDAWLLRTALRRSGLPAPFRQRYVARLQTPGVLTGALGWYRAIWYGTGRPVGSVGVPTHYLWGTRDPFFARSAVLRTGDHVRARFRSTGVDEGHWLPERRLELVAAAVLAERRRSGLAP
jgi:pimeloyl-ACP methyl ester carboxylesterase